VPGFSPESFLRGAVLMSEMLEVELLTGFSEKNKYLRTEVPSHVTGFLEELWGKSGLPHTTPVAALLFLV